MDKLCNGAANCDDFSDEDPVLCNECKMRDDYPQDCSPQDCPLVANVTKCDDSLFCVMNDWICDYYPHCLDMSDEISLRFHCNKTCEAEDMFWGKDGTMCVPVDATCNGLNNCPDESDEAPELCKVVAQQGTFR